MNPILQNMNSLGRINQLKQLMQGNPNQIYAQMMQNNPQFAMFVNANKGKSPEEIARAYGIDPSILGTILK